MNRKDFIKKSIVIGTAGVLSGYSNAETQKRNTTPSEVEGPFYPLQAQKDKDFDLTEFDGRKEKALGEHIFINGVILDEKSEPIEDAMVDLWQANAFGKYRHPHDNSKAKLDPNFQGWAIVQSGTKGEFRFKTVFPGTYLASDDWERPPHIHFKVMKRGYLELMTQMYFPNHPLNENDFLIKRKEETERKRMVATLEKEDPKEYKYTIVLQKV
ncbi:MAG: protocatechuate 3,4-dioxygenase [Verrucomicrobiota bacterium]